MLKEDVVKEIPCDKRLAAEMVALIDGSDFGTVKRYMRSTTSAISLVVILEHGYRLEQLAAVFVKGSKELARELFSVRRALTLADDESTEGRPQCVLLDSIADEQVCNVIYMPPAYLVQFE